MMPSRLLPLLLAGVLASSAAVAVDREKGKEINGTCAACHGDQGAGGKKGEYPRIAGQRVAYIENQLKNFRSRTRVNIPMYPYTQERELSDEDIKDIAAYLAGIELSNRMPTFKGTEDALTRLQMVDRVMIIPRAEGNLDRGQAIYQKQCASCHGKTGKGDGPDGEAEHAERGQRLAHLVQLERFDDGSDELHVAPLVARFSPQDGPGAMSAPHRESRTVPFGRNAASD